MRTETISGSTVLALCNRIHPAATVWSDNLKRILQDWVEESADTPQPVSAIEEYLYETLSEQGRSKSIGNGLFLATAHAVKGLEFDHVFILGDNWNKGVHAEIEDERRLYYVSMSRARETLHLFSLASCPNPHVTTLSGDFLLARKCLHDRKRPGETCSYSLLGMDDLFLDFAAQKAENHPARLALKRSGRAIS
jgi:ATP-dependent DNA helicase RecQ